MFPPKNERMNEYFTTMKPQVDLFFVCFLEEFEDTEKTFPNYLTFRHRKNHEICTLCEVVAPQFYYYECHSSKIANQWPLFGKI